MKTRKNQQGQAIVELTVSLVLLLAMFCGFVLIAQLATSNIQNIIGARGEADENGFLGTLGDVGQPIMEWSSGGDGYLYTADDQPSAGTLEDSGIFKGELKNADYDLTAAPTYIDENFAAGIAPAFLFLYAAELTSGSRTSSVTLDDLSRMLYVDNPSITLQDDVFMPLMSEF